MKPNELIKALKRIGCLESDIIIKVNNQYYEPSDIDYSGMIQGDNVIINVKDDNKNKDRMNVTLLNQELTNKSLEEIQDYKSIINEHIKTRKIQEIIKEIKTYNLESNNKIEDFSTCKDIDVNKFTDDVRYHIDNLEKIILKLRML